MVATAKAPAAPRRLFSAPPSSTAPSISAGSTVEPCSESESPPTPPAISIVATVRRFIASQAPAGQPSRLIITTARSSTVGSVSAGWNRPMASAATVARPTPTPLR